MTFARTYLRVIRIAHHHVGAIALRAQEMTRAAARALNKPLLIVGIDRKLVHIEQRDYSRRVTDVVSVEGFDADANRYIITSIFNQ